MDSQVFKIQLFCGMPDSFRQNRSGSLAANNFHQHIGHLIRLAVIDCIRYTPSPGGFNGKAYQISGGHRINAVAIAQIIQINNFFDLIDHAQTTEGIKGLVFRTVNG